jgi:oligopeptide transport system permease protein
MKNAAPCSKFWFGSDDLGRDIFIRIWIGVRISLFIGLAGALIDIVIGVIYGASSALFGGRVDEKMMRLCDIFFSIPRMLVIILFTTLMEKGVTTIILAMSITGWIPMARIIRAEILQIKGECFVTHAVMIGASFKRILFKYLLANSLATIVTTLTLTIPAAIFAEAFLSFLGLGVQAPIASLGTMAADGLSGLNYYPWRLGFPALVICLIMLTFNILGDSLNKYYKEST